MLVSATPPPRARGIVDPNGSRGHHGRRLRVDGRPRRPAAGRLPRVRERLHRPPHPPRGAARGPDRRGDPRPHQGDRPQRAGAARRLVVLRAHGRGAPVRGRRADRPRDLPRAAGPRHRPAPRRANRSSSTRTSRRRGTSSFRSGPAMSPRTGTGSPTRSTSPGTSGTTCTSGTSGPEPSWTTSSPTSAPASPGPWTVGTSSTPATTTPGARSRCGGTRSALSWSRTSWSMRRPTRSSASVSARPATTAGSSSVSGPPRPRSTASSTRRTRPAPRSSWPRGSRRSSTTSSRSATSSSSCTTATGSTSSCREPWSGTDRRPLGAPRVHRRGRARHRRRRVRLVPRRIAAHEGPDGNPRSFLEILCPPTVSGRRGTSRSTSRSAPSASATTRRPTPGRCRSSTRRWSRPRRSASTTSPRESCGC